MKLYDWLAQKGKQEHFRFEAGRVRRAGELKEEQLSIQSMTSQGVDASYAHYPLSFIVQRSSAVPSLPGEILVEAKCGCEDYAGRYRISDKCVQFCKHLIRLLKAVDVEDVDGALERFTPIPVIPNESPLDADIPEGATFTERLSKTIGAAVDALADQVVEILKAGRVPFLVGPTGCGKTSAVSMAALKMGARFYETAGADSWTDSDLVGVMMPNGTPMPGPIGAAMTHACELQEPVLIFLDEFLRFSLRAQESMMRVLLPKSTEIAKAMGIDHNGPVRVTSAPFWGESWAPAELCHIVLAANPWGCTPDAALLRRVEPITVGFNSQILSLFKGKAQNAISISWKGVADGSLPLPIEYGELVRAQNEEDLSFVPRYVARMNIIDPAAGTAFTTLLNNTQHA